MDFHEQAKAIWSTLDKLALEDPEGYKTFIQEQLSSVNEVFRATTSSAASTSSSKSTTQGQNLELKFGQNGQFGLMKELATLLKYPNQTQNQPSNLNSSSNSNEKKESKSKTMPNLMRNDETKVKVVTKVDHEVPSASGSIKKKEKGSISGDGHDNDDDGGTKKLTDDVFGHSTSLLLNPFIIQELEADDTEPEVLIKELRLPGQVDKNENEPADDGPLKMKKPLIEEL